MKHSLLTILIAASATRAAEIKPLARQAPTTYKGADLAQIQMPVGGIVAGQLYFNGDGSLGRWDIMNARSFGDSPVLRRFPQRERMLQQGFSLRVQDGGKLRNLPLDLKTFPATTFTPEFPAGIVRYAGAEGLPLDVKLEGIAPFVPLDTKASGIPAAFLRITLKNTGTTELKGDLLGWLENGVAAHSGSPGEGVRTAASRALPGALAIEFAAKSSGQSESKNARPTVILADFETTDYMGWKPSGEAFGTRPLLLNEFSTTKISEVLQNPSGSACAGSVTGGPEAVGVLESPEFKIDRDMLRFKAAWGRDEKNLRVELVVDGNVVRTATGSGTRHFAATQWDVREFNGKPARLVITDESKKNFILVDQVELADAGLGPLEKRPDFGGMALVLLNGTNGINGASAEPSVTGNATAGFQKGAAEVPFGQSQLGAITAPWSLTPGATRTLTFAVAWHFPNLELMYGGKLQGIGRWYASRFAGLPAVTEELAANGLNILKQTDLWRATWYDSTLPRWVLDRVMANAATLATSTCFRFKDGRFYGFEGVYSFNGTCSHVWHYAEANGRLFPELEMSLRTQVELVPGVGIKSDGGIPMRIAGLPGSPDPLPIRPSLSGPRYQPGTTIDGQCGIILRCYRSHLTSTDDAFVRKYWPQIKLATQWLITMDSDGDGLPEQMGQHTLDEDIIGPNPWISSLWLAAVSASGNMATIAGDKLFAADCRQRVAKGEQSFMEKLWKGDRFVHLPLESEKWRPGFYDGVHIDQLLGQQWAWRAGLPRLVPEKQTRIALETIFKHNFMEDVGPYYSKPENKPSRALVVPGDAGTLMATWPEGSYRPDGKMPGHEWNSAHVFHQGFYPEMWSGCEHALASLMVYEGLVEEGLRVFRAVHDRHQPSAARPRNPFNEPEAGDHYSRAMASYAVLLALSGFDYNGPAGAISFAPRLGAEDFRAAFTAAEGWGSYSQRQTGKTMSASIALKCGQLKLKTLGLVPPVGSSPKELQATLDGTPVPASLQSQSGHAQIAFSQPLTISTGQSLMLTLE